MKRTLLACTFAAAVTLTTAPASAAQPAALDQIRSAFQKGRYGSAVFHCDREAANAAQAGQELDTSLKPRCARANLGLGDKLRDERAANAQQIAAKDAALQVTLEG